MKFIENQSVINKLQIFEWNENSLCNYLSSDSRDIFFLKFQSLLKFEIRRI